MTLRHTCTTALSGLLLATHALAQDVARDPTAPPLALLQPAGPSSAANAAGLPDLHGASVVRRNGQPHLLLGGRLLAVGQRVGDWRIDRITETDIWLRQGRVRERVSRLDPGVRLRPATPAARSPAQP